jgi:hypothetical protein
METTMSTPPVWKGSILNLPNTQDDFEVLGLGRRQDVLGKIAVARSITPNDSAPTFQNIEIGLIVRPGLAINRYQHPSHHENENSTKNQP